jgi:hypothetical protein
MLRRTPPPACSVSWPTKAFYTSCLVLQHSHQINLIEWPHRRFCRHSAFVHQCSTIQTFPQRAIGLDAIQSIPPFLYLVYELHTPPRGGTAPEINARPAGFAPRARRHRWRAGSRQQLRSGDTSGRARRSALMNDISGTLQSHGWISMSSARSEGQRQVFVW